MGEDLGARKVQDCALREMFAILSAHSVDTSESEYALDSASFKGMAMTHLCFVHFYLRRSHRNVKGRPCFLATRRRCV
jgi:hypothetical protein